LAENQQPTWGELMNRDEFEQLFRKPASRIAGETQGRLIMGPWYVWVWRGICKLASYPAAWIVALLTALAMLGGCSTLPSVQSCRVAKYERQGDVWSAELRDCRVMQAPLPVGL